MTDTSMDEFGPVDYLVIEFPAGQATFNGEMAAELAALSEAGIIRILDLVVIVKDADGNIEGFEIDDFEQLDELRALESEIAEILAADDLAHLAEAMEPGTTAGVLVWENTWATPFACRRPPCRWPARRQRAHSHPSDRSLDRSRRRLNHATTTRTRRPPRRRRSPCCAHRRRCRHRRCGFARRQSTPGPPRRSSRSPLITTSNGAASNDPPKQSAVSVCRRQSNRRCSPVSMEQRPFDGPCHRFAAP